MKTERISKDYSFGLKFTPIENSNFHHLFQMFRTTGNPNKKDQDRRIEFSNINPQFSSLQTSKKARYKTMFSYKDFSFVPPRLSDLFFINFQYFISNRLFLTE